MQTKTNESEWPIAPTFLSLRKGCKEDTANYNTDGIYNPFYIRGFLADLSQHVDIQNAVSLFQFVPKDFLPHDPNSKNQNLITGNPKKGTVILNKPLNKQIEKILEGKKIIRIDSGTYVNNGRLCDVFRNCNGRRFCFIQDSIVGIFAEKRLNQCNRITDENEYTSRLKSLINIFNKNRKKDIEKIKYESFEFNGQERFCLHYTCHYSLFEEHIFPIYLQGRVIACLMFGQMGRDNFNKNLSFKENREIMEEWHPDTSKYLKDIKKLDDSQWRKKAKAIVEHIEIFERQLEEKIEYRNNRYINTVFADVEQTFREEIKVINIKEQDAVKIYRKALDKAFDSILRAFGKGDDGFIRMFAQPIDTEHEKLIPIGWSGAEFNAQDDFYFSIKKLNSLYDYPEPCYKDLIKEAACSKIKTIFNDYKDVLLPGWLAGKEVVYIVWKRHGGELTNPNNKISFDNYKKALRKFFSVALECYSYIRGTKMELLLETTIQESAHESAHFILPAIDAVENKMNCVPDRMILGNYSDDFYKYKSSYSKFREEVLNSLNQLREINYGSSLIYSKDFHVNKKPERVSFLIINLTKMLENRALDSHKYIDYNYRIMSTKEANIDAKYFNHALYNLLDNAIKYGYEGSYIHIKLEIDKNNGNMNIIIISYGIKIENDDRIYNLFTRSEDAAKMAGGTGIGMYIVRKICRAHGGDVTHYSEKLSDYNIPLLLNYKQNPKLISSIPESQSKFDKALFSLSDTKKREVVCDSSFVNYSRVFSSRIETPTFRNTFYVTIPL